MTHSFPQAKTQTAGAQGTAVQDLLSNLTWNVTALVWLNHMGSATESFSLHCHTWHDPRLLGRPSVILSARLGQGCAGRCVANI